MFGQNIKRKNLLYGIFFAACLIFALVVVGRADAIEAEQAAAMYCDMVRSGAWPDYNGNYDDLCLGGELKPAAQEVEQ